MMQLDLFPGGRVPSEFLDGPMCELEEQHGVAYWQMAQKEQEATAQATGENAVENAFTRVRKRFSPKFGHRFGERKTQTIRERA